MACHADGAAAGAVCCVVGGGGEGPVLKMCTNSSDGVPLPPTCRLGAPRSAAALALPGDAGRVPAPAPGRRISRPLEPAEPIPLVLS
jgi:hypothetical protein